ncbi:cytochrome c oxidase subunit II [Spirochaetia bacterium]|nr:cytochrome c oxidase subunit II [Spirochaetia bacterium]
MEENGVNRLMEEETEKIIHHINAALPGELAESLSQSGELKEKLLGYFEQNVHALAGAYAPGTTPAINTGEVEKSLGNMYRHLQGHIQRGMKELENQTNSLLRQNGQGAFIRGDKAYTVVKSSFRDNPERPATVTDLKLCINIPESDLSNPIFHYQVTMEYLIKDILSKNITDTIDREAATLRDERLDEGLEELTDAEILISKLARVGEFTDDNTEDANAKRYSLVAKEILDRLKNTRAEIDSGEFDQLNIRENLKKIVDSEHIRDRGFNTAVNSLCAILDNSRLGFQFIENFKNARELIIREYDDTEALPDERYQIRMRYCDGAQLVEERRAYDAQMRRFEEELCRIRPENPGEDKPPLGDGCPPGETDVEKMNPTYLGEKERIEARIRMMRERCPQERLDFLEKEYTRFNYRINPYHLQAGLVLDVDVTSIKRRRITLDAMSKALNEFLQQISRGFQGTERTFPSPAAPAPDGQSFGDLLNEIREL